jgi:hypothetical protein
MGGPYDALPFPRGQSYGQGISSTLVTIDATFGKSLVGNLYRIRDEYAEGNYKILRVVKNASGSALTTTHRFVGFLTSASGYFGRFATTSVSAGDPVKPIDDAYDVAYSVPANDLFYVVEQGFCKVGKPVTGGSFITAPAPVYTNSSGLAVGTPSGANFVAGRAAITSLDATTEQLIEVEEGLGY